MVEDKMQAVTLLLLAALAHTSFAGRAFPVEAENYAVSTFQQINPRIEWDPSNFLVDLSGRYALCSYVGQKGQVYVDRATPEGDSIGGMTDYMRGTGTDSETVTTYIESMISGWINTIPFADQIRRADRFGCSVQPGCTGHVVIACMFSPEYRGGGEIENPTGAPKALAFTEDQYDLAESILGSSWDRSHLIENMSGYETDCAMIDANEWAFAHAKEEGRKRGMTIEGLYGSARNKGDTETAMIEILESWKYNFKFRANEVGCSLIPDCMSGRGDQQNEMYVVVSCLFSI